MKIEWMNNNKEFKIPKITVQMDVDILTYMEKIPKETHELIKKLMEYRETLYMVLNQVDKNVTREMISEKLTTNELTILLALIRTQERFPCTCPHCKKNFMFEDMPEPKKEGDTPLSEKKPDDTTATKDAAS